VEDEDEELLEEVEVVSEEVSRASFRIYGSEHLRLKCAARPVSAEQISRLPLLIEVETLLFKLGRTSSSWPTKRYALVLLSSWAITDT